MKRIAVVGFLLMVMCAGRAMGREVTLSGSNIQDVTLPAATGSTVNDPSATELGLLEYWRADTIYDIRGFIKINLSSIPSNSTISSATFGIWYIDAYGETNVNQLTVGYTIDEFDITQLNYSTYDGVNMWTDGSGAGVDGYGHVHPHLLGSVTVNPAQPNHYVTISSPELIQYLQAQVKAGKSAYLELAIDSDPGLWQRFYSVDCGDSSKRPYLYIQYYPPLIGGDANRDGVVDVRDLGILATNYGMASGAQWSQGDFNGDGAVNVVDLGVLATNYLKVAGSSDAKVPGQSDTDKKVEVSEQADAVGTTSVCGSTGLALIIGLYLVGVSLLGSGKLEGR